MAGIGRSSGPPDIVFAAGSHGVNRQVPVHMLGPDELYDSSNVWFYNGSLQPRPGLRKVSTLAGGDDPVFASRPMGCFYFVRANNAVTIIVSTKIQQWKLESPTWGSWTDITETGPVNLTGDETHPVRMTQLNTGGTPTVFLTNGKDHLKSSVDGAAFVDMDTGGVLPKFTDITTVGNRIVGIYPPYGIRWSDVFNANVATTGWPSLNYRNLSDTADPVVAVRNLGTQGIVVYKLFSLWAGYAQAGSPANAFRFDYKGQFEAPCSPGAVVDAGGVHYYLGRTGRIGRFDGVTHTWVADGVWPILQADMDPAYSIVAHGVYHSQANAVAFYYKRKTDAANIVKGMLIITLPRPQVGILHHGIFPGLCQHSVTCGALVDLAQYGVYTMVAGGDAGSEGVALLWSGDGDLGTAFNCSAQTGLQSMKRVGNVEIEPFLERGTSYGTTTLNPVTSFILSTPGGTVGNSETIDLTDTTLVHDVHGFEASGRFVGLKVSCTSADTMRYKGGAVFGYQQESL